MRFLDKYGWPVERVEGRPALSLIRLILHTRKIVRHWEPEGLYALARALGSASTENEQASDGKVGRDRTERRT